MNLYHSSSHQYPCGVILTLTVPVIDHSAELHNWNRWLNILHCVTGPTVVALLTKRTYATASVTLCTYTSLFNVCII